MKGETNNFNWGLGPIGGPIMWFPNREFAGGTIHFRPVGFPVGASATKSNTVSTSLREWLDGFFGWRSEKRKCP
jgi:hypothetical protein